MTKHLQVKIVTPEKVIISDRYVSATIPAITGELTILPKHIPLVTPISPGEIILKDEKGQETFLSVSSGILEVRPDSTIAILADSAERAEEIDLERSEKAKQRIEEIIKNKQNESDVDYASLQSILAKEMARIKVAKRHSNRKTF